MLLTGQTVNGESRTMKPGSRNHIPRQAAQRSVPCDPESVLESHQRELAQLYLDFGAAADHAARRHAAERICHVVAAQCEVEDELLYPEAARVAGRPDNRLRAAQLEGSVVRKIVDQIRSLPYDDRRLAGTLDVLKAYVADYLDQQRTDVLPRLRRTGRASRLGEAMVQRRAQILGAVATPLA
jgi:hypothetical protein